MKPCLLIVLSCLSVKLFSQTSSNANHQSVYTIENVQFKSMGVSLAGAIFMPKHPHAAVILVHGSGQERRMVNLASNLARNGIAVLTYDKRGVGESGGVYAGPEVGTNNVDSANLNLLALDASAAAQTLLLHLPGKKVLLGLVGFSQAGWVIPIAAEKNSEVRFMILFSGPVATTLEQLRFQFYTNGKTSFWETHSEADVREHIKNDPDRYQFTATDPLNSLIRLKIPGLWLYGGKDIQAPVGLSIERIDKLKAQGKPFEYHLFPMLGHNTAFSKSQEPYNAALQWIKDISHCSKKNGYKGKSK
ncbi:alpha/beta hydrolase family protein [Pedobacter sp. N23S346]|uniref:alpha/beta hydrolase family protein n=1 Tax=Pedobacter sp. N23S346 TaxID=3402750 RepID=UPI003ACEB951